MRVRKGIVAIYINEADVLNVAMFGGSRNQRGFFMCLTPVIKNYCFFGFSPIFCVATPRNAAGHGKGEGRMLSCCVESSSDCNKS